MKKWLFAIMCIIATQSSFAKEEKLNEKIGSVVNFEEQFVPQLIRVCSNCSREIMEACYRYTSTISNERLCVSLSSNPEITKSCYYNSSTASLEADCLRNQINPGVARGCKQYTSTTSNERLCGSLGVSSYDAETCYRYSSTTSEETECLRSCGERNRRGNSL